ncbi:PKD domain-containing protein [Flavobacteriales bacterium]|nr:PKD domain-containing protein [Flavobacteriales bacterium]
MKNLIIPFLAIVTVGFFSCQPEEELEELPVAGYTYATDSLEVTCTSTSTGTIVSLTWEFGDTGFNTDEDNEVVTHEYDSAGTYSITLTAANGSGHGVDVQTVTVP